MVSRRARAVIATILAASAPGCTLLTDSFLSNNFSGDANPVNVNLDTGAILVGLQPTGGSETTAVLDLLSPLTTSDPAHPLDTPDFTTTDLTMLGLTAPSGAGPEVITPLTTVARARFVDAQLISIHACDDSEANAGGECHIGPTGEVAFQSVLGADTLAGDAVRLRLADKQIFVLPDVGGSDHQRSLDCDAVFDSPYRGGGTLVIAGTEVAFGNRRIALGACLGPHPEAMTQAARGTDALFVVSTAIRISIIGQSAYDRYVLGHTGAKPIDTTIPADNVDTVYLPSGVVHGQTSSLEGVSLVAPQAGNALAPCRQIYAHRILALGPANTKTVCTNKTTTGDCPCEDSSTTCNVPAILELKPTGGIPVLVVDDNNPTLQALRTELRPDQAEVDGILGTDALKNAEFDIDYPHDRLLARCAGGACCTRPELVDTTNEQRAQINRCIAAQGEPLCPTTALPITQQTPP